MNGFRPKLCWICGKVVILEDCRIDEHGLAVHEDCYVAKVALGKAPTPERLLRVPR